MEKIKFTTMLVPKTYDMLSNLSTEFGMSMGQVIDLATEKIFTSHENRKKD